MGASPEGPGDALSEQVASRDLSPQIYVMRRPKRGFFGAASFAGGDRQVASTASAYSMACSSVIARPSAQAVAKAMSPSPARVEATYRSWYA